MTQPASLRPHSSFGAAFLQAADEGRLVIARCGVCHQVLGYTRRVCRCGAMQPVWETAGGQATVCAWAIYRRAYSEAFAPPWRVVRVRLAEGPQLCAIWTSDAAARTGDAVTLAFDADHRLVATPSPRTDTN